MESINEIFAHAASVEGISANGKGKNKVRGRKAKTSDHQEAVVSLDNLSAAIIGTLVADLKHAQATAETFNDGIKAQAEKAGIQSSVLRKFIAARAGEKFADAKRDALQLSLLFEEIGG